MLTITGAMQIDQALFLLDSSAVVGTTFGGFTLTATIAPVPPPIIAQLTVDATTATLQVTNGIPRRQLHRADHYERHATDEFMGGRRHRNFC